MLGRRAQAIEYRAGADGCRWRGKCEQVAARVAVALDVV